MQRIYHSNREMESDLLEHRIIYLAGDLDYENGTKICGELAFLDESSHDEITFLINSPGGGTETCLGIYDMIQAIKSPVKTICVGEACSAAACLLAWGTPGLRFCSPRSYVMIHKMTTYNVGDTIEIDRAQFINKTIQKEINKLMAKHTGQSIKKIQKDCERDFYMTARQAVEYGIVDGLLSKKITKL